MDTEEALTFKLHINLGNDAMQTPENVSHALDRLADNLRHHTAGDPYTPITLGPFQTIAGNLRDSNGNRVGSWAVK